MYDLTVAHVDRNVADSAVSVVEEQVACLDLT